MKKESHTLIRYRQIYEEYCRTLEKYGDAAPYLSRGFLYEEVGDKLGWSAGHVYRAISTIQKNDRLRRNN